MNVGRRRGGGGAVGATLLLPVLACSPASPRGGDASPGAPSAAAVPVRTAEADPAFAAAIDSARALLEPIAARGVGLAVDVRVADEAVWVAGFGPARPSGDPVDPEGALFPIYSLTKPMTAVAVGRLMERGELDPDAPVQRYVPGFPVKERPVTPMGLATHTAGIRHYRGDEARAGRHCESVSDALPVFAGDSLLSPAPGEESYSSWGYVLLSAVLEGITDRPYGEAMGALVFDPAGMPHARVDDPRREAPDRVGAVVEREGRVVAVEPVDNTCKWGAGALVATAPEVARFAEAMFDGTLLSERTASLFLQGRDAYRAQGVGVGGTAFMVVEPGSGTAVALLSNVSGETLGPALQRAFERIRKLFAP